MSVFIEKEGSVDWWGESSVIQTVCEFNSSLYDDGLFKTLNISFPEKLLASSPKRKAEFLAGRCCAKSSLELIGMANFAVGIGSQRNPLWPSGVRGAISHCHQTATAVVTRDNNILGLGVDVEDLIAADLVGSIVPYVLQESEELFLERDGLTAQEVLTIIFSIKESFYKSVFPLVGKYFDFFAITIVDFDKGAQKLSFQLNYSLHQMLQKGKIFTGHYRLLEPSNTEQSYTGWKVASFVEIARD